MPFPLVADGSSYVFEPLEPIEQRMPHEPAPADDSTSFSRGACSSQEQPVDIQPDPIPAGGVDLIMDLGMLASGCASGQLTVVGGEMQRQAVDGCERQVATVVASAHPAGASS